jgi:CubicO group peptidase (beta-lactamase class C family)
MDERDLAEVLAEHAARHGVPGAAAGILREGEVLSACCGAADVSTGAPVTPETRWSAGSLTKSMVATVVTLLADEGRLALDDPAAMRVPELRQAPWARTASLLDLLANRSPIPLRMDLEFGFDAHADADAGALARLVAETAALEPTPGRWSYSNVGWCALGRAVEAALGLAWEDAMRGRLFDPAGMAGAAFMTATVPRPRVAGHEPTANGPVPVPPLVSPAYAPAGTTLLVTVSDLLRFAALHLEQPVLASMRTVEDRTAIHGWLDGWCRGWAWFDWEGAGVWGWDGLVNGERSMLRIVPEQQAAIVLLTNSGSGRAMCRSLCAELMAAELGVRMPPLRLDPIPGATAGLERFAGTYAWPDRRVDIEATAGGLLIRRDGVELEALPLDRRSFLVDASDPDAPAVTFGAFDAEGRPQMLYEMLWGLPRAQA